MHTLPRPPWKQLLWLVAGVVLTAACHSLVGAANMDLGRWWGGVLGHDSAGEILWQIRFPRLAQALLVGASLGMVGSAFQSVFKNPIADPYIAGVSSGAALGGACAIAFGLGAAWQGVGTALAPMLLAAIGGLGALWLVIALAGRQGSADSGRLLLCGVVVGSFLSSALSLVLLWAGQDTNQVLRWLLGSLTPAYWSRAAVLAIFTFAGALVLMAQSRSLNVLSFGDETASRLGVDSRKTRLTVLLTGTIMVGASVGAVGIIGFLGLVGPHIARRLVGVDWRWSLPASGLCGAGLLTFADLLAQRSTANAEIPVGIMTALLGAPWLLVLLRRAA